MTGRWCARVGVAEAAMLAAPGRTPLGSSLPGVFSDAGDGLIVLDGTTLESAMLFGIHDDGRVTWASEDGPPVLHIGQDSYELVPWAG